MAEVVATYDAGADITCEAAVGLTGGRAVGMPTARNAGGPAGISDTGDGNLVVGLPAAQAAIFGVASHDAVAGKKVNIMRAPKVVPIECSAAITPVGTEVQVGADGRVAARAAGGTRVGVALSITTAAGQYCQVALYDTGTWSAT